MKTIPIQSISDVITNSSSEVYLYANNSSYVRDLIDEILKLANSDYTCDELFQVENLDSCYGITALDNANSESAYKIEYLINSLFDATD